MSQFLGEPPHITDERNSLKDQKDTLLKAANVLQRDPQIAAFALEGTDEGSSGPRISETTRPALRNNAPSLVPGGAQPGKGPFDIPTAGGGATRPNLFA